MNNEKQTSSSIQRKVRSLLSSLQVEGGDVLKDLETLNRQVIGCSETASDTIEKLGSCTEAEVKKMYLVICQQLEVVDEQITIIHAAICNNNNTSEVEELLEECWKDQAGLSVGSNYLIRKMKGKFRSLQSDSKMVIVEVSNLRKRVQEIFEEVDKAAEKLYIVSEDDYVKTLNVYKEVRKVVGSSDMEITLMKVMLASLVESSSDKQKSKPDLNNSIISTANKHKQELAIAEKDADDSKAGGEDLVKVKKDLEEANKNARAKEAESEQLKKEIAEKDTEIKQSKSTVLQLKKIGRNFREKAESAEKTASDISEEKKKVEEELAKIKAEGVKEGTGSTSDDLEEAQSLLEATQVRLGELEAHNEALKREKEIRSKATEEIETRAKNLLKNARAKIDKVEEEKKQLTESLDQLSSGGSSKEDLRRKAMASQLNSMRQDKERLEGEKNEAVQDKEKLTEEVEKLQQQLVSAQLSTQGVVRTRPQYNYTVGGYGAATGEASLHRNQEAAATTGKHPASQAHTQGLREAHRLHLAFGQSGVFWVVDPRQDQPQASKSGPIASNISNAPSTSGASGHGGASPFTPTTASVPPTLKRPRDSTAPDSDSQSSVEDRAGPSGYQKKARTISSTEFLQVSSTIFKEKYKRS